MTINATSFADTTDEQNQIEGVQPEVVQEVDQPPEQPEQTPPAPREEPQKAITMPTAAIKRIKGESRAQGRAEREQELNAEARRQGFNSHEDMVRFAAEARKNAAKKPQKPAAGDEPEQRVEHPRKLAALEREVATLRSEKTQRNRRIAELEKEVKRMRRELDAKEADGLLRIAAARHGVRDVDYALHVCRTHCANKTEQELASFDEDKFFGETLLNSHPYLYSVQERPANTAPDAREPTPESPRNATPPADPLDGPVDATKLSPEQYQQLLRKRGLTDPRIASYAG
jgi:hypothetical protein